MNKIRKVSVVFVMSLLLLAGLGGEGVEAEASAIGDDYPAVWKNRPLNSGYDTWGMAIRNCTSFVANRLSVANKFNINRGGRSWNANQWDDNARVQGYAVDKNPVRGSVAYWETGTYGHVAWVAAVDGDRVLVEEYNYDYKGTYRSNWINRSAPTGYIHFKDMPTTNTLGDWVTQKTWGELNVGIWDYYTVPHTLQWKYYNVDAGTWHFLQRGDSNWTTLAVPKGNYWVHVEVLDSSGKIIDSKTMATDGATNSVINGANVSLESNGEYLLGASSNNPYMSYVIKLYNYNTGKWFTQYNAQWARFRPEKGVKYGVQFEIYGWNRRLDYQMYTFYG